MIYKIINIRLSIKDFLLINEVVIEINGILSMYVKKISYILCRDSRSLIKKKKE